MNQLEEARQEIDQIDADLADLFEKRMDAVCKVAAYKKEKGLPVFDQAREQDVIARNAARISDAQMQAEFEKWIVHLMELSKKRQRELLGMNTVAYCGVEGAFAHSVTKKLFPNGDQMPCSSFDEVFEAVAGNRARYGVLPLENTNSGLVGEVLDGLMQYDVFIVQEADIKIRQCLLGLPEAVLGDIRWVYSKDQALAQSRNFLKAMNVETIPYPNTAMAAQYVASQKDVSKAAIGSRDNAMLYNLKILAENIESDSSNTTRFLVISSRPVEKEHEHSSFLMSVANEVGNLAKAINVISAFGLNMDSLQSRPRKGHPFEYFFYVQTEGRMSSEKTNACMNALNQICASIKWLGSYTIRKDEQL